MLQPTTRPRRPSEVRLPEPAVRQVGDWRLLQPLAHGAMAEVFAASAGESDRETAPYAVKVLREKWHDCPEAVLTIHREAALGTLVCNPHVVPVLDAGVAEPPYFTTMPRLPGETLDVQLRRGGGMPVANALWIARQVATGLSAIHQSGWTHGDVSPSNIMVAPDGHVTLLDLGYAFHADERRSAAERPVVGTLHYLAPEMITSALAADSQCDLYSLGTVLYEMLTGQLPYEGRGPTEIVHMQRAGVPDRLRCLVPTLSRDVVTLVRQLLCSDPLRRPESAAQVVERLIAPEIATFAQTVPH